MKKALISIRKVNNQDVIATSVSEPTCDADLNDFNCLFQYNGTVSSDRWSVCNGNFYQYKDGIFTQFSSTPFAYFGSSEELESGKWYHVKTYAFPSPVEECKNPEQHIGK